MEAGAMSGRDRDHPGMNTLPDFKMDVEGKYYGGAYYQEAEYRVRMMKFPDGHIEMLTEDGGGFPVTKNVLVLTEELIDGITRMATTDHTLSGYEDDWKIPVGMDRHLEWTLQTDMNHHVVLNEAHIDQISAWLRYATGEDTYEGDPNEWDF